MNIPDLQEINMKFTLFIIAAFIIWFSSIWVAVLSLLSFIGGWKTLSRLYPLTFASEGHNAVKYSMSSIKMGFVNYRSCVNVFFTETGIIFKIMKIFSVMHKPLFIPYDKISEAQQGKLFISTYTSFIIENKKITIYGKAGDELFLRLKSRGISG